MNSIMNRPITRVEIAHDEPEDFSPELIEVQNEAATDAEPRSHAKSAAESTRVPTLHAFD